MTEYRDDRENLINVREKRGWAEEYRFDTDKATGDYILEGYAATYEPYDCHGGPDAGGWIEQLDARAFDQTLREQPDVQLLINHTGEPLARTKSGTLKLSRDGHGLKVWARLDPSDPDVQRLAPKMKRKDMDEMSFAFRVTAQDWDSGYTHRTIRSLSLQKGDVSVVNYGMNPGTQAAIDATVDMLSQLSNQELCELRSQVALDPEKVKRAVNVLSAISEPTELAPAGSVVVQDTKPQKRKDGKDSKEPYGDVTYADPGYKTDGKKRYPINNASKVRSAWSYINMPKNQAGYSAAQVKSIKGRIQSAAKKFGVDISDSKSEAGLSHVEQEQRKDGAVSLVAVMTDGTRVPLPAQRALPAATKRVQQKTKTFNPDPGSWSPNTSPADPHDDTFGEGSVGTVGEVAPDWGFGPVPGNIMGGDFQPQHPTFDPPTQQDPHDIPKDQEDNEELAMDPHDTPYGDAAVGAGSHLTPTPQLGIPDDPHDTPYSVGGQVGAVPGDRPNSGGPQGQVAPNIVTTGAPLGGGNGVAVSAPPMTGTNGPVDAPGQAYDWTNGDISEPGDPAEELDHPVGARGLPTGLPVGSVMILQRDGSWAPTNIEAGGSMDDEEECGDDADDDGTPPLDLCMAEALDRTIVHCYHQAKDNVEVRKTLVVMRKQLSILRGLEPGEAPQPVNEIQRRLDEIRSEVGQPETGTVNDYFKYLRSAGTAPVGYRGLLDSDPELHVTTAGERLAREALQKEREARSAAADADVAAARVKAARREAELNDAIRRRDSAAAERPRRV